MYESRFGAETLLETFYRPFLASVSQYDRLAGYLSLRSLAVALEGVDSLLETDGHVRVIAGGDLQAGERGAFFPDADDPLSPWVESQLAVVATLLDRGDLEIRVATPRGGDGLFHPKLGIGEDPDGNCVSFEGSVNETLPAWRHNYERFKLHRSWVDEEAKYVDADRATFDRLWRDDHDSVDVHDLDAAARENLLDWTGDNDDAVRDHVERVRSQSPRATLPPTDVAGVVSTAGRTPGGLHLAEDIATVDPWPHQRTVSDTAVSVYPNNLLFCDEVGLGKTIEVGLTLSRLRLTGAVSTALLLVPAGLIQQWQTELLERFGLHAYYYDHAYDGDYLVGPFGDADSHRIRVDGDRTATEWTETPIGRFVTERPEPSIVLQSWHTARRGENQRHVAPSDDASTASDRSSADYSSADHSSADNTPWDLVVVDEAHNARKDTQLYDLLTRVNEATNCLYALTATPMQLEIAELYNLLRLCDLPSVWDDRDQFARFFETRMALETALDEVDETDYSTDADGRRQVVEAVHEETDAADDDETRQRLEQFARMLSAHVESYDGYDDHVAGLIDDLDASGLSQRRAVEKLLGQRRVLGRTDPGDLLFDCGPPEWRALVDASEWATPVQSRIFRNTRRVLDACVELDYLDETVPTRSVETTRIELGDAEPLYERIEEYIDNTYEASQRALTGKERLALGFVMTTYRQRLTSSLHAITESLQRRVRKLDEEVAKLDVERADLTAEVSSLSTDAGVTEATVEEVVGEDGLDAYRPTEALELVQQEQSELESFVSDLDSLREDPKVAQLRADIFELRRGAADTIVIFTQYHDTLEYVADALVDTHPNVGTYSGDGARRYDDEADRWESVGRETIVSSFTDDGGTNILVCTDSASEGLNLQTAAALVNYDLPWNPMRVEQRIGRIDRIGQEHDVVEIINYAYEDSVDGDIYEQLEERLNLFENVVGPTRPILNSIESDIESAVMGGDKRPASAVAADAEARAREADAHARATGLHGETAEETYANVIDNAGVDGWNGWRHPAISEIGFEDRRFDPVVTPTLIETLLTQSDRVAEAGWSFTALRNHERVTEFPGAADDAYVLERADADAVANRGDGPETAQQRLASDTGVVVTFSPDLGAAYPSIRLLLPGDPLYAELVDVATPESTENTLVVAGRDGDTPTMEGHALDVVESEAWDVLAPAVTDTAPAGLPDGRTLADEETARESVREWLGDTT